MKEIRRMIGTKAVYIMLSESPYLYLVDACIYGKILIILKIRRRCSVIHIMRRKTNQTSVQVVRIYLAYYIFCIRYFDRTDN